MELLALIFAYIISHTVSDPIRFRQFNWFISWSDWLKKKIDNSDLLIIVTIAVPVSVISTILFLLAKSELAELIISIIILSFCIGPESMDDDVKSEDSYKKWGLRKNAKIPVIIKKMTQLSLQRWFGVFFWYLLLGIVGVLIYRLSERLNYHSVTNKENNEIQKVMTILNYPVAWMMVIALAIASDFERVFKKCKPYMKFENIKKLDDTFLYEATDFAVENCEIEEDNKQSIQQVTLGVLKRMLVVWLVFASLLVILEI